MRTWHCRPCLASVFTATCLCSWLQGIIVSKRMFSDHSMDRMCDALCQAACSEAQDAAAA